MVVDLVVVGLVVRDDRSTHSGGSHCLRRWRFQRRCGQTEIWWQVLDEMKIWWRAHADTEVEIRRACEMVGRVSLWRRWCETAGQLRCPFVPKSSGDIPRGPGHMCYNNSKRECGAPRRMVGRGPLDRQAIDVVMVGVTISSKL